MELITKQKNDAWILIKEDLDLITLKERILGADVCISDIDDTDAKSPAKNLAYHSLIESKVLNPKFWLWCLETGTKLLADRKKAEIEAWKKYVENFLRDPKELQKIKARFTDKNIEQLLYPGTFELYVLLKDTYKIYITGNIEEIAQKFTNFFGFDEYMAEVFDKEKAAINLVERKPWFKNYFVKGDSKEDELILNVLNFYKKKGKLESITSCCIVDCKNKINEKFDINIGKNYFGLVQILNEKF